MNGLVCDVQRFSISDGPGIRTTVFLQGCTLRCAWCHNPEGIPTRPVLRYAAERCVRCGACAKACPNAVHRVTQGGHDIRRDLCITSGECVKACPAGALRLSSREADARDVIRIVLEDRPFYLHSGGGMTLSGGEPLLQAAFALELLAMAKKEGIDTALETAGHVPEEVLLAALPLTDLFLYDFKTLRDPERWIGADGRLIIGNLRTLGCHGARIILRCPVIPGVNDTAGHLEDFGALLRESPGILSVELLAYHRLGIGKYRETGQAYCLNDISPMTEAEKADFLARAQNILIRPVKWG